MAGGLPQWEPGSISISLGLSLFGLPRLSGMNLIISPENIYTIIPQVIDLKFQGKVRTAAVKYNGKDHGLLH